MSTDAAADEQTPARPSVPGPTAATPSDSFRPLIFLLSSLTADNIDAATVARHLQPHFKPGDFYVVNAAPFASPAPPPADAKKAAAPPGNGRNSIASTPGSTPGSVAESLSAGVLGELGRIAAARDAAREAAAEEKAAQLAALQAEFVEDGMSAAEALAAARAELRERSDSDGEKDEDEEGSDGGAAGAGGGDGESGSRRLPPVVCLLNAPLTCSAVDGLSRAVPGIAAALLLESRCCVRELVGSVGGSGGQAGGAGDKSKPRGGGTAGSAPAVGAKDDAPAATDDIVEFLDGAPPQLPADGAGLANVLVQRVAFPTEGGAGGSAARPTVSPAHFVSTLHALLLRIFQCWQRFRLWSAERAVVSVPHYTPLQVSSDAVAEWATAAEEAALAAGERRPSRSKSSAPSTGPQDHSGAGGHSGVATTAVHPATMAEVAAEAFEYGAYMQQWVRAQQERPPSSSNDARAAVQACVRACLHQMGSGQAAGLLRSRAEVSTAQLREDVRETTALCAAAHRLASGAADVDAAAEQERAKLTELMKTAWTLPFTLGAAAVDAASTPETLDASMAAAMAKAVGSADVASLLSHGVVSTCDGSGGDVLHWLRGALVAREGMGWVVSAAKAPQGAATLCCVHRPLCGQRTAHSAFVFAGPTTFPQFYCDEAFVEAERRTYERTSSIGSESEAEEEEEDEEEEGDEEVQGNSVASSARSASVDAAAAPPPQDAAEVKGRAPAPAAPAVDHAEMVMAQLQRRRVLEQVRRGHSRPPVQELGAAPDARCTAAVAETSWLRTASGGAIEVSRTVANGCQVRCSVTNAAGTVRAGYMLECPLAAAPAPPHSQLAAAEATAEGLPVLSPPAVVESGVRCFVEVGDRLRVFTRVVADNAHAVAVADYAAAVAAAREAAAAQHEAQFSKGAKAAKARDKGTTPTVLTLEEMTATLLAALPPPPAAPSGGATPRPPSMAVHALFPVHGCVATAAQSASGVAGLRLTTAPASGCGVAALTSPLGPLMAVHLWWQGRLCSVHLRSLSAVQVYVDGVTEVFSAELPAHARLLLHPGGGYVTLCGGHTVFVSARGRCVHCAPGSAPDSSAVVHQLHAGWAAGVSDAAVTRFEREDGMQQEYERTRNSHEDGGVGPLRKTFFGHGVSVFQEDVTRVWTWCFCGLPAVTTSVSGCCVSAALDASGEERWIYSPADGCFTLEVKGRQGRKVAAATLGLAECRLRLMDDGVAADGLFVVDCAFGGLYGRVHSSHAYRVSPFGRFAEEVAAPGGAASWQLVLPPQYRRPKRRQPEVVLAPEFASDAFRQALCGDGSSAEAYALHLQQSPAIAGGWPLSAVERGEDADELWLRVKGTLPIAGAAAVTTAVCCVAIPEDGETSVAAVMDAVTLAAYLRWLERCPGLAIRALDSHEDEAAGAVPAVKLCVSVDGGPSRDLRPLTDVKDSEERGADAITPASQPCVLLHRLLTPSGTTEPWPAYAAVARTRDALGGGGELAGCGDASRKDSEPAELPLAEEEETGGPVEGHEAAVDGAGRDVSAAAPPAQSLSPPQLSRPVQALRYWTSSLCPPNLVADPPVATDANAATRSRQDASNAAAGSSPSSSSAASPASSTAESVSTRRKPSVSSQTPLMQSHVQAADAHTGTTAASRYHSPLLEVRPQLVDFGNVQRGRRYVARVALTNTSVVPCRYRVRVAAAVRSFVTASYPRHFVAPGMTVEVAVELSGWQPDGVADSVLSVVHEGGVVEVGVVWCSTADTQAVQLGRGVVCAGWSVSKPALQHPGVKAAYAADAAAETSELDSDSDASVGAAMA